MFLGSLALAAVAGPPIAAAVLVLAALLRLDRRRWAVATVAAAATGLLAMVLGGLAR